MTRKTYRGWNRTTANSCREVGSPPAKPLLYARWAGGRVEMPPTAAQDLRLCEDPTCGSKERGEYVAGLREVPRWAMLGWGEGRGRGARGDGCEGRRLGKS